MVIGLKRAPRLNPPARACIYGTARGARRAPFRWARGITSFMLHAQIESPRRLPGITVKG
jgi:hypothetical protein